MCLPTEVGAIKKAHYRFFSIIFADWQCLFDFFIVFCKKINTHVQLADLTRLTDISR